MDTHQPRHRRRFKSLRFGLIAYASLGGAFLFHPCLNASPRSELPHPILFVTQVPQAADFTTIGSTFGNHLATLQSAPRGGDLWILYPDGELRNLTEEAGFGQSGFQGEAAIAVRDPAVHWNGGKAVFSMAIGAPDRQFQVGTYYWQLHEVSGLAKGETAAIVKVPNQPGQYNNVSPLYGTDDRILFASDRPRNGKRHLYPQLDEYEEAPTVTGVWSLDPATGDLFLLDHAPSGAFTPILDSFGRVIFTRWDHLQRDQQADADAFEMTYGTFNFSDESADATVLFDIRDEVFPEPRQTREDLLEGTNLEGHRFNLFFPWMMHETGEELETLNHVGRHELHEYFNRSVNDDPNVREFIFIPEQRQNPNPIDNLFQLREDPTRPGVFYGIDAPEFATHSAGQIVTLTGAPGVNPDFMEIDYITHRSTSVNSSNPQPEHSGLYRNPLPLSNGGLIAVHTSETREDRNDGTRANPRSRYDFRLKRMTRSGDHWIAGEPLTPEISESLTWWDPDVRVQYEGPLWQWSPVEVKATPRPGRLSSTLETPERNVLEQEAVEESVLRDFLRENELALIVSRNVTARDLADVQQPYNLRVADSNTQTVGSEGKVYDISHLQLFQADQIRGVDLFSADGTPGEGRRPLAQPLHDSKATRYLPDSGLDGAVKLGSDGSMAAFVPARRALSWQLVAPDGEAAVRERYWLTFQPGEIRTCANCHGINRFDQAGNPGPTNEPEAFRSLLRYWKSQTIPSPDPNLAIRKLEPGLIELQWTDSDSTDVLEYIEHISASDWQPTEQEPTRNEGQYILQVPTAQTTRFYRLRKQ